NTLALTAINDTLQERDETIIVETESVVNGREKAVQKLSFLIPPNDRPTQTPLNAPTHGPTITTSATDDTTGHPPAEPTATPTSGPTTTGTPNTPATGTPTNEAPTTTAPPSTPAAPVNSLIQNGGFEAADLVPWVLKNASKDKVKCKAEKARSGTCAF